MSTSIGVTAFHHVRHTKHHHVFNVDNMLCLTLNLTLKTHTVLHLHCSVNKLNQIAYARLLSITDHTKLHLIIAPLNRNGFLSASLFITLIQKLNPLEW